MKQQAIKLADSIVAELKEVQVQDTPNLRAVRSKYSQMVKNEHPTFIIELARIICKTIQYSWVAYELICYHPTALQCIGERELTEFGNDLTSWGAVDAYAGLLSGPVWRNKQISDEFIQKWANSEDRWLRRTALVSTIALNRRSIGGYGDIKRTLAVCRILRSDKDDMVVKAMSWALRELIPHNRNAVLEFLEKYDIDIAPRVRREVINKLTTGLKNPGAKSKNT